MLAQVITENGVKKLKPLTADAGAGAPVGFIASFYKKGNYSGWLYCDGSTFDETKYPLLYAYLGSNVLPDLRELGLKGAEKNTTYIFDSTETDPRTGQAGTQNHDVFTQGEFKDDQVQEHSHNATAVNNSQNKTRTSGSGDAGFGCSSAGSNPFVYEQGQDGRKGTVTRGKSFGVFYYIKATSGLTEGQQDDVANIINGERSYSTDEINTGKKWIDGKDIFRKVLTGNVTANVNAEINISSLNISHIIDVLGSVSTSTTIIPFGYSSTSNEKVAGFYSKTSTSYIVQSSYEGTYYVILEYTKTT